MEEPPKKSTAREVTEAAIEAGTSMVPLVGGPIATAFAVAMGWAYNRRMQEWLGDLATVVTELQERADGLTFEELADDDAFIDAVVQATRSAQATHDRQKLEALRNGVVNSLSENAPAVDERARFFRLIDELTPSHVRLLAYLADPDAAFRRAGRPRPSMEPPFTVRKALVAALPEFAERDWVDLLRADLGAARLITNGLDSKMGWEEAVYQSFITPLGRRFLQFITDPQTGHTPV